MPSIFKGSPSFRLFWNDVSPIAKTALKDAAKAGAVILFAALASSDVKDAVANHFGTVVSTGFATLIAIVGGWRLLRDNSKG
jgi:hypothetical protein